ncbi:hypothetical protein DL764_010526 [Monosporascus ibericus]|uniref:Uncharacterized protein n=1 Tax=Monosporascus ibericus TaxID=155417 RepID=A0A4Q4STC2_9PEZI|nr:hypothetical protein DL764_010526 [Monosporascus ibericus]
MLRFQALLTFSIGAITAANPAEAQPLAERQANDCLVNRALGDLWIERGMTRRQVLFSAEGTPPEKYCDYWTLGASNINNVQCYEHGEKGWVVEISHGRGLAGDYQFTDRFEKSLTWWRQDTHCKTG